MMVSKDSSKGKLVDIIKENAQMKSAIKKAVVSAKNRRAPATHMAPFAGVSQVDVAPVNIGNTIRSTKQQVIPTKDGVTVIGRDFVATVGGQVAAFTGWCLQAGLGLSPVGLNAAGLRGYFQVYQKYKWKRCVAHYVTSSPTSTSGDILMVYHSNHGGPKVNHLSTNFLSYALSTDNALIGPQWTNHSIELISGKHDWRETDILNAEDVQHQADGELLVYAKATTNGSAADSPGYLLIDYEISFENRMLNPRVQVLPASVFKFIPTGIHVAYSPTQYDLFSSDILNSTKAYNNTPVIPDGMAVGDIYQVVLDVQNAVFSNVTAANALVVSYANTGNSGAGTYMP